MDAGKLEIINWSEAKSKGLKFYFTGKPCPKGHIDKRKTNTRQCRTCATEYYENNKEKMSQHRKKYYQDNKEKILNAGKQWAKNNRNSANIYIKNWKDNNKDLVNANTAKRRASKLNATPEWLNAGHTAEIEGLYLYAQIFSQIGEQLHVDHIVPLQGKDVCGLHAPWNLQVIPASENLSKSNKLIEE